MKHFLTSLTLNGSHLQMLAMLFVFLGIGTDQETVLGLFDQIVMGISALVSLVGMVITYIGRLRANPNIAFTMSTLKGSK